MSICQIFSLAEEFLQCGPAEVQPLVLSPNWWTCIPRRAFGSLPLMFHVIVVGADSDSCSKVTVPLTVESPRTVATKSMLTSVLHTACFPRDVLVRTM